MRKGFVAAAARSQPPCDHGEPGDGSNYLAEVLTWGAKKRIVFRRDQLGKAILGYVAADLAEFNANPDNPNPGNLANPNGDQAAPAAL